MKKQQNKQKLVLDRETVKRLSDHGLEHVVGGLSELPCDDPGLNTNVCSDPCHKAE